MTPTNIEVVKGFVEVLNKGEFDRLFDYCSPDCAIISPPYVGFGVNFDDSSGEHSILCTIAPSCPAAGKLQLGDELVRVSDGTDTWETFDQLRSGLWGQGRSGTSVTITVRRDGQLLDYQLERGRVEGMTLPLATIVPSWRVSKARYWPDLTAEIQVIFGEGEWVACYMLNSGVNLEYRRSAMWAECDILRLSGGKIVEIHAAEDSFAQMKQLGYDIREPQPVPAA